VNAVRRNFPVACSGAFGVPVIEREWNRGDSATLPGTARTEGPGDGYPFHPDRSRIRQGGRDAPARPGAGSMIVEGEMFEEPEPRGLLADWPNERAYLSTMLWIPPSVSVEPSDLTLCLQVLG
jgi:hypothetical protein